MFFSEIELVSGCCAAVQIGVEFFEVNWVWYDFYFFGGYGGFVYELGFHVI